MYFPSLQDVKELASITYYTGDEWDRMWAKRCRRLNHAPRNVYRVAYPHVELPTVGHDAEVRTDNRAEYQQFGSAISPSERAGNL